MYVAGCETPLSASPTPAMKLSATAAHVRRLDTKMPTEKIRWWRSQREGNDDEDDDEDAQDADDVDDDDDDDDDDLCWLQWNSRW